MLSGKFCSHEIKDWERFYLEALVAKRKGTLKPPGEWSGRKESLKYLSVQSKKYEKGDKNLIFQGKK